jgi:hypothetical protein
MQDGSMPPGVTEQPRLSSLANNNPTKKASTPKPAPKTKAPPKEKPLSKAAVKYAIENMPGNSSSPQNVEKELARLWGQVAGYKRLFPDLDYSQEPNQNAPSAVVKAFVDNLGAQLCEKAAVVNMKKLYCLLLDLAAMGNTAMKNPLGLQVNGVPKVMRHKILEEAFMDAEFKELAILHPEWCRPGPLVRLVIETLQVVKEVHQTEAGRGMEESVGRPVKVDLANKYSKL